MRHPALPALLLSLLAFAACTDAVRRGSAGESCQSARDCAESLACVAQVCVARTDAAVSPASSGAPSGAGCGTRRDCAAGLVCVTNTCQAMSLGQSDVNGRFSGRGESCRAKNDCAPPLACVDATCQMVDLPLGHTTKSCHRVECAAQSDCCAGFVPHERCDVYKENCATDPIFCNTYRSLCECRKECVDQLCVDEPPGCKSSAECTSEQTPHCVDGKCGQCDTDAACGRSDARCVQGMCIGACTADEQCPALQRCRDGVCKESGCESHRECAFLTKSPRALCTQQKCQVPCEVDRDCNREAERDDDADESTSDLGFQVCRQGQCVFVGCESDVECRALLGIENERGNARAVCR